LLKPVLHDMDRSAARRNKRVSTHNADAFSVWSQVVITFSNKSERSIYVCERHAVDKATIRYLDRAADGKPRLHRELRGYPQRTQGINARRIRESLTIRQPDRMKTMSACRNLVFGRRGRERFHEHSCLCRPPDRRITHVVG